MCISDTLKGAKNECTQNGAPNLNVKLQSCRAFVRLLTALFLRFFFFIYTLAFAFVSGFYV